MGKFKGSTVEALVTALQIIRERRFMNHMVQLVAICATSLLVTATAATVSGGHAYLICFPDYKVDAGSLGEKDSLGHAGVLIVSDKGFTRYYEFGRYNGNHDGIVKNRTVSNVKTTDGKISPESLTVVMSELSKVAGKGGRIRAAHFINVDFDAMRKRAEAKDNGKYDELTFNCGLYAEAVILQGNRLIDKPTIAYPRPVNVVDEYIEEGNAEVLFDPEKKTLTESAGDEADAKVSSGQ